MLNLVLPVSSQDNYLAQIFSHSLAFEKNEFFELLLNRYSYCNFAKCFNYILKVFFVNLL